MGQRKFREFITSPGVNITRTYNTTAAVIANRVVKTMNTGNIKHTTGSSGRVVLGVAIAAATGASKKVPVVISGIVDIEASSRAIATGALVRATSGSASTATRLGGTVRTSTNAMTTAAPIRHNIVGMALTSAAASTGRRVVTVFVNPTWNNPALL